MLASAGELGAKRLSVCGDDPDPARLVASFAELCDLAAGFGMGVDLECMAWRQVASLPAAVRVVQAAGRPNGGALVDAIHLSRTGGSPADLKERAAAADPQRPALRCPGARPATKRRSSRKRAPGGCRPAGRAAPVRAAGGAAADAAICVEVPMAGTPPPEQHARAIFDATRALFERCREGQG